MLTILKGLILPWGPNSYKSPYVTIQPIKRLIGPISLANLQLHQKGGRSVFNKYKTEVLKELIEYFDLYLQVYEYKTNRWTYIPVSTNIPDSIMNTLNGEAYYSLAFHTKRGECIGDPEITYKLYKMGIKPELGRHSSVCNIGFCERDQSWYTWGRVWCSFTIGSSIRRGDIGYYPNSVEAAIEAAKHSWSDDTRDVEVTYIGDNTLDIRMIYKNGDSRDLITGMTESFRLGRGEWVANTLEDAKEMACDFSDSL
jgi:hypothetical protein